MTITPEQIAAYVDGECDAAEALRIEEAAGRDPGIARRIAGERALGERLRGHFAPISREPVPEAWAALIRSASATAPAAMGASVSDLSEARARRARKAQEHGLGWTSRAWIGSAIAASLVLGLFMGMQLPDRAPFALRDGGLIARGTLARALDTQLASAQGTAPVRMLVTFRSTDGSVCRAFAGQAASGIACRSGGEWQLRHVLPGTPETTTEYRQADSRLGELSSLAQGMATGEAFDARQELAAKQNGWR